jgi:hypothetical protein
MTEAEQDRLRRAAEEREHIERAFPKEFADGRRRAFLRNKLYPRGFKAWPIDRRNAWFAGWNIGYVERKRTLPDG